MGESSNIIPGRLTKLREFVYFSIVVIPNDHRSSGLVLVFASKFILSVVNEIMIERFSFECRKVIGFALSTRCDWLKRFAPPFHPIRSETKANCDALACIFPRFASATCNYFEF